MKVFAFVLLALATFNGSTAVDVAGDVIDAINKILDEIPEPAVEYADLHYEFNVLVEKIEIDVASLVLKGIKNLDLTKVEYDADTSLLEYDLTFTDVSFVSDLTLTATGLLLSIVHNPYINLDLTDLKLSGYAVVDTEATPNQLTDFKLLVTLGGATVELKNIGNDDDATQDLSDVLNESLPAIVDDIATILEPAVSPIIQSIINIILRHTE